MSFDSTPFIIKRATPRSRLISIIIEVYSKMAGGKGRTKQAKKMPLKIIRKEKQDEDDKEEEGYGQLIKRWGGK